MRRTLLAVLVVAAGCSGGSPAGLAVEDPWAPPSPNVAANAAFFLTLENTGEAEETLVSASSEACRATELHESTMTDGVMSMQQVTGGILVPASQTVLLQPGGLHVMCIDKTVDFADGGQIELSLQFLSGDGTTHEEKVTAVVEDR